MAGKAPVTLFLDYMSQPSRAVLWFARLAEVPHTVELKQIAKLEHKSLGAHNPMKQVPALHEPSTDFSLFESHAIMRYLANTRGVAAAPDLWPADPHARARVDAVLDWHHTHTRRAATVVFQTVLGPRLGLEPDMTLVAESEKRLSYAFKIMSAWLADKPGTGYVAGTTEPSLADLSLCCEIEQMQCLPDFEARMAAWPEVLRWLHRMRAVPHYDEVHGVLYKVAASLAKRRGTEGGGAEGGGARAKA